MKKFFEDNLSDHQEVFSNLLHLSEVILEASELIVSALNKNGKINDNVWKVSRYYGGYGYILNKRSIKKKKLDCIRC